MTDFFSAYLFLAIGIILLIVALAFKKNWLYFIDCFAWLFAGLYTISHQDATQPFILYLGLFFLVMAIVMGLAGYRVNKVEKIKPLDQNDPETWDIERADEIRKQKQREKEMRGE